MQNVREHPGLMRDEISGAIVNGDSRSLMSAQAHLRQNEELNNENGLDEFSDILESTTDENKTSIIDELTSEKE